MISTLVLKNSAKIAVKASSKAKVPKRLGPNLYLTEISHHIPKIGIWFVGMTAYLCWPSFTGYLNKKGYFYI
ncbi:hypothetical protein B5S28_g4507 [[Candida] boidinii]|nr:hypothetical protein B5S28_g4507 [[Candida] boidinii]OWB59870.1 hypothetical protein B5S29_g735 [[Candida] boidinii]OWB70954.1 hypothetical protein B5S31_g635 [[Candida] boidinii]OWB80506.1 hypothetical protein B5S32_g4789 [[Candida] boidinii]